MPDDAPPEPLKKSKFNPDKFSDNASKVVLYWSINTILYILLAVLSAQWFETFDTIETMPWFVGGPVLAALLVSAFTGGKVSPLRIASLFLALSIELAVLAVIMLLILIFGVGHFHGPFLGFFMGLLIVGYIMCTLIYLMPDHSIKRRCLAGVAVSAAMLAGPALSQMNEEFYRLAWSLYPPEPPTRDRYDNWTTVDQEALWQAQPALIAKQVEGLPKGRSTSPRVFTMAVGAQGSQSLFSREAQIALERLSSRFSASGSMLLINGRDKLSTVPVVTPRNFNAAAKGLGGAIDPSKDTVVIYLTSHGAPGAWLATDLPDRTELSSITAYGVKAALDEAGIQRRVIIISACYAGSWISILANPDTIILTASSASATSFGCDDRRRLTYFGEALLDGPLKNGAPLAEGFFAAKRRIAKQEKAEILPPSSPQFFVGANMKGFWLDRGKPAQ